jgi:hypothetical protein
VTPTKNTRGGTCSQVGLGIMPSNNIIINYYEYLIVWIENLRHAGWNPTLFCAERDIDIYQYNSTCTAKRGKKLEEEYSVAPFSSRKSQHFQMKHVIFSHFLAQRKNTTLVAK